MVMVVRLREQLLTFNWIIKLEQMFWWFIEDISKNYYRRKLTQLESKSHPDSMNYS